MNQFTYQQLEKNYKAILELGYEPLTMEAYCLRKKALPEKCFVNRVDVDFSVKKVIRLLDIFSRLNIKSTFFIRLHAPEYNPFSFENYKIIKSIIEQGHEIGYHSEIVDQSKIWDEEAESCLKRDIDILNRMFNINIVGVASHGGMTGFNNLDFWKDKKPSQYNLLYEAYDFQPEFNLFQECFYVSDSEWLRWKCYDKGKRVPDDARNFAEHALDGHRLMGILIHPDSYFDHHYYEHE